MFIYSDIPIVRGEFYENFYLLLLSQGDVIFEEEPLETLQDLVSKMELDGNTYTIYNDFKSYWESATSSLK